MCLILLSECIVLTTCLGLREILEFQKESAASITQAFTSASLPLAMRVSKHHISHAPSPTTQFSVRGQLILSFI